MQAYAFRWIPIYLTIHRTFRHASCVYINVMLAGDDALTSKYFLTWFETEDVTANNLNLHPPFVSFPEYHHFVEDLFVLDM